LLEIHNREELDKALITGARLIGVNNRDLKTFNVSLAIVEKLGPLVKKAGAYLISESGIHQKEDVERVRLAGANGILVGESLMKSNNVKQRLESFRLRV
jgi:indole-3-glycerol phosphate synthase